MSQFDFGTIDPDTKNGTVLATDLNSWRDALHSMHRGASRPTYAAAGMVWVKEVSGTLWELTLYDGTNDVVVANINPTTGVFTVPNDTIGNAALQANAVNTGNIVNLAITAAKLGTDAVETSKILSGAVTTVKIADGNVGFSKLSSGAVATIAEIRAGTATGKIIIVDRLVDAYAPVTLTDAATIAVDGQTFFDASVTITASRTMGNVSNRASVEGRSGIIRVFQTGGPHTLSWASEWRFADGEVPTLSAGLNIFAYTHATSFTDVAHAGGSFA